MPPAEEGGAEESSSAFLNSSSSSAAEEESPDDSASAAPRNVARLSPGVSPPSAALPLGTGGSAAASRVAAASLASAEPNMASTARLGAQSGLELSEATAAAAGARAEGGDET